MGRWRAHLDANAIIRFVEAGDTRILFLFEQVGFGRLELFTSEFTLTEVLVRPLATGDRRLMAAYDDFLTTDEFMTVVPVSRAIITRSAELRSVLGGKSPDALHVATAIEMACTVIISSDRKLKTPAGLTRIAIEAADDLDRWP